MIKMWVSKGDNYPVYFIRKETEPGLEIKITEEQLNFINKAEAVYNTAQMILKEAYDKRKEELMTD